jgi:hypothetical protein
MIRNSHWLLGASLFLPPHPSMLGKKTGVGSLN